MRRLGRLRQQAIPADVEPRRQRVHVARPGVHVARPGVPYVAFKAKLQGLSSRAAAPQMNAFCIHEFALNSPRRWANEVPSPSPPPSPAGGTGLVCILPPRLLAAAPGQ